MIKMAKIKDKEYLKNSEGKHKFHKGNSHKAVSWLFTRNSAGQKGVGWYIESDKRENQQPRILYQARLLFRFEGKIKIL